MQQDSRRAAFAPGLFDHAVSGFEFALIGVVANGFVGMGCRGVGENADAGGAACPTQPCSYQAGSDVGHESLVAAYGPAVGIFDGTRRASLLFRGTVGVVTDIFALRLGLGLLRCDDRLDDALPQFYRALDQVHALLQRFFVRAIQLLVGIGRIAIEADQVAGTERVTHNNRAFTDRAACTALFRLAQHQRYAAAYPCFDAAIFQGGIGRAETDRLALDLATSEQKARNVWRELVNDVGA